MQQLYKQYKKSNRNSIKFFLSIAEQSLFRLGVQLSYTQREVGWMLYLQQMSQLPPITNYMVHLAKEKEVEHICFLLALRATETHVLPKTFKDVTELPADSKKRWLESCLEKLKSLKNRVLLQGLDNLGTTRGECLGRTRQSSLLDLAIYLYYFTSGYVLIITRSHVLPEHSMIT